MFHPNLLKNRILKYTFLVLRSFILSAIIVACFSKIPVTKSWAASIYWVGGTDTSWETAANWSTGVVPTSTDDVLIDVSTTVNIDASTTVQSLVLGNSSGTTTPILNFNYDAITNGPLTVGNGNLHIYSGGQITHTSGGSTVGGTINISVTTGNLLVDSGGSINTTAKGYTPGYGPGAGSATNGAGYGGTGGNGQGKGGTAYGNITNPTNIGSGGGSGGETTGGTGGGVVILLINGTFTNNGTISSNGTNATSTSHWSAAGSGGGSLVIASELKLCMQVLLIYILLMITLM